MMIVPGASVVRYSTAVRLYSGSNSTASSGRSPGWSPTSGCCAKLGETENISPTAAIIIQIRCRNLVIQNSPRPAQRYWSTIPGHPPEPPKSQRSVLMYRRSFRRDPQPQAVGHDAYGADPAEPKRGEPQQALYQRSPVLLLTHQ